MAGKLLKMFFTNDDIDGLSVFEFSNYTIQGTMFPRASLGDFKNRKESQKPGVYLLFNDEYLTDEGLLYIGEGDPVLPRLQSHSINKDFWTYAVVFTSKDENLTKTQIQYIEARLIKLAIDSRRIKLDNSREEDIPSISESGQCEVELFLYVILDMLHALRFNFFEPLSTPITVENNDITYEFKVKKACAKMIIKNGKYILLKDSTVQGTVTPRAKPNIIRLREKLINDGLIIPHTDGLYIVTSNIEFNSSSYAADVVAGYNVNGLDVWKYNNQSLKELENQA